uniref:Uncharacterized protein n=1 Tax=Plectus sambesii TaxID=2011161 RepID=A0A914XMB1_9BILA
MKTALSWFLLLVLVGATMASWGGEQDASGPVGQFDQVFGGRVYRAMLLKSKRSPSIGLSLAEYMASPQSQDNFHFIPARK